MKIKVIKRFLDNATGETHLPNDIVDKSEVRAKHIIERGYAVKHKEASPEKETKEEKTQYKTK